MTESPIKTHPGNRMWPFSEMSLATATWWSDAANLMLIFSLVAGVISTFVIVQTGNVKEHHWEKDRQASGERIAALNRETERLSKEGKEAGANIAEANARALEAQLALEKFK